MFFNEAEMLAAEVDASPQSQDPEKDEAQLGTSRIPSLLGTPRNLAALYGGDLHLEQADEGGIEARLRLPEPQSRGKGF